MYALNFTYELLMSFRSGYRAPVDVTIADGTNHHVCVTYGTALPERLKSMLMAKKRFEVQGSK